MRTRFLIGAAIVALAAMAISPAWAQAPKDVTVTNTTANPVPVQERREPFEADVDFIIEPGQAYGSGSVAIPSGKRFVLEYVSVQLTETARLAYVVGGSVPHYFPTVPGPTGGSVGGQSIRVYSQTSMQVWVELAQINSTGIQVGASLSGYLVDVR